MDEKESELKEESWKREKGRENKEIGMQKREKEGKGNEGRGGLRQKREYAERI